MTALISQLNPTTPVAADLIEIERQGDDSYRITVQGILDLVPASGEANTASNLGGGQGLFASKVSQDLQFKSLVGGSNVSLSATGTEITISAALNMGDLSDVTITGVTSTEVLQWNGSAWINRTLTEAGIAAASDLISHTGDSTIHFADAPADDTQYARINNSWQEVAGGGGGEANTSSNVGGGAGLALAKVGIDLPFKTLIGGTNVTLDEAAQTVTINAAGGGANELNDLTDVTVATPSTAQVLRYTGAVFQNATLVIDDVSGLQGALDGKADQVTTYTKAEVDAAIAAAVANYLPLTGGTLTGPLTVQGDVTATGDVTGFQGQ